MGGLQAAGFPWLYHYPRFVISTSLHLEVAKEFSQSGVGSESDLHGAARLAAQDVSRSGVGDGSDLFAAARRAAVDVSDAGTDATAAVLFAARGRRDFEFAPPGRCGGGELRHIMKMTSPDDSSSDSERYLRFMIFMIRFHPFNSF